MDQNALIQFLPLILIFVVFYFLLIRPQQKKQKEHRAMLEALRRGDRIVTGGGFYGTVSKVVSPEEVEVDLAPNVRVRVVRGTITTVLQTSGHSIDDVTFLNDGNKILFARQDSSLYSYIEKISLDGSGRAVIVKSQRNVFVALPSSSPDSTMLVYTDYGSSGVNPSVYKVSVNGGPKTNLTSDSGSTTNYTLGWRTP